MTAPSPSDVWVCFPTCNPENCARVLPRWKARGYRVALLQDRVRWNDKHADVIVRVGEYHGYPWAVNLLCRDVPALRAATVVVAAGDDMEPDPVFTAAELLHSFLVRYPDTFGVMQPIGDTLAGTDRICGSPWMGRAFRERINGGKGPQWPGYYHYFADEEMWNIGHLLGCLWLRRDVAQPHNHWVRCGRERPPYMDKAQARWDHDKALFSQRKIVGFPGHAPLPHQPLPAATLQETAP